MFNIIDTNYIVRYILQDDLKIAEKVHSLIDSGVSIIQESLVEITYVLNKGYKVPRKEISNVLNDFLNDIDLIDKILYETAFKVYAETKLDYVDCILVARHRIYGDKIHTLDKELNNKIIN